MPRLAERHVLKSLSVRNAKPGTVTSKTGEQYVGRTEIADAEVPGLRLLVRPSGHKSFVLRYTFRRKYCKLTLRSPVTELKAVRDEARVALQALADGNDPKRAKHDTDAPDGSFAAAVSRTVEGIGKGYKELHVSQLRAGTQLYVRRELDRMTQAWSGRALREITKRDILDLMDRAATRGPTAPNSVWKVAKAFFAWCEAREDNFISPARTIKRPHREVQRDRVLDDAELAMIWHKAGEIGGKAGAFVKLLMLTGARRDEIAALRWDEIKSDRISLPRERTKTNEAHEIYLTDAMRKVLKPIIKREGDYVLGSRDRPISATGRVKNKFDVAIPAWRFHDLRRSFSTGCARIGIAPHIVELMLNHRLSGVAGVYNKHRYQKEMLAAWEKWSSHISKIVNR
jgi:integrase